MSYLVFARKWRPLTFDDVVGQDHITDTLKKSIEKDRVAHAYIFSGTRGVGKTTTARILARALNCENGPTPTPCGVCNSCKDIMGGASFDVLEIDGASNNSVNDIRELRENVGYSSMGGKYRIFVIDEVHMLSNSAFNALLKTLEEPPKNVIFIFATTEPQKIPATIHSRCQRYDFRRIDAQHILERLIHICNEEKISFDKSALMLVARKADGSMRDALSLLDQVYSFCQDHLAENEVRSVLGLVGMEVYDRVMDAVAGKLAASALGVVQDVLYQGFDLHEFIVGLQEHLRNLLFARIPDAFNSRSLEFDEETAAAFAQSAARFSEGDLLRMAEIARRAENELKWSAFPRFLVEIMLLKLVYIDSTLSIEKMIKLFGSGPDGGVSGDFVAGQTRDGADDQKKKILETPDTVSTSGNATLAANEPGPEVLAEAGVDDRPILDSCSDDEPQQDAFSESSPDVQAAPVDVERIWPAFLESLLRDRPKLGSFLSLASVTACSSRSIDIRFSSSLKFQYQELNKKQHRDEIRHLLQAFTRSPVDLRMTLELQPSDNEDGRLACQTFSMPITINDEIEHEPVIRTVLDMFDGEVIE